MSVPCSDTETRSASFWSFNHCLLSFTLSSLACWWFHLFILSVAKCNVVFHYSPLYFAGFISDIMLPLCLLTVTRGEGDGPFRCRYHMYIVYSLDSEFTLCCLCFCCGSSAVKGLSVLSGIERWVISGTNSPCLCQSSLCCSSVSRPGRRLMMVNAFTMNMNASTKCIWNRMADSTCDLGSRCHGTTDTQHILNTFVIDNGHNYEGQWSFSLRLNVNLVLICSHFSKLHWDSNVFDTMYYFKSD